MKYSKQGLHYKELKGCDVILVTNTKNGVSAKFMINEMSPIFFPFISFRILEELSLGAIYSDDFYFLRYLKRKEIEWEKIKDGAKERKKYE